MGYSDGKHNYVSKTFMSHDVVTALKGFLKNISKNYLKTVKGENMVFRIK